MSLSLYLDPPTTYDANYDQDSYDKHYQADLLALAGVSDSDYSGGDNDN